MQISNLLHSLKFFPTFIVYYACYMKALKQEFVLQKVKTVNKLEKSLDNEKFKQG